MSTFRVEAVTIDKIFPHPNADRLELAQIKGWQCAIPNVVIKHSGIQDAPFIYGMLLSGKEEWK